MKDPIVKRLAVRTAARRESHAARLVARVNGRERAATCKCGHSLGFHADNGQCASLRTPRDGAKGCACITFRRAR